MQAYKLDLKVNQVLCHEGDPSSDLYFLQSGKLLICTIQGTQVKAIARIEPGEFIGELSFFDGKPRASHIVALEASKIIQIPKHELSNLLPLWLMEVGKSLTKKIRLLDSVINGHPIRKSSSEEQKPLSIEEQRVLYKILSEA
jgi:CRP/FNR family transcriptional regulator, cyclic AMP receptor protein